MQNKTREIPRGEWASYVLALRHEAEGSTVSVELISETLGDQPITDQVALRSLTYVSRPGSEALEIDLGEGAELDHRVLMPTRLLAIESDEGGLECLDIEDAEGEKTLIRFERPLGVGEHRPGAPG